MDVYGDVWKDIADGIPWIVVVLLRLGDPVHAGCLASVLLQELNQGIGGSGGCGNTARKVVW